MRKNFIVILMLFLASLAYAQTGIGVFAGPQMTFFQPDNTTNYRREYNKFSNPQQDYNMGVFGWLKLKNDWLLNFNIGFNTKTYLLDNKYPLYPGYTGEEGYGQGLSGDIYNIGVMKRLPYKKWEFYPFISLSYILNQYLGNTVSINSDTNPYANSNINFNYNSFGLEGGIVLHNQKKLKRFMLKINYTYEIAQLPSTYDKIGAVYGPYAYFSTVKWQGHFSYINFDLMFYIKRWTSS